MREEHHLKVKLTEAEKQAHGELASELDQEKRAIEAQKKAEAKAHTKRIKALDEQISELTKMVTEGVELRDVWCVDRESNVNGQREVVRTDDPALWPDGDDGIVRTYVPGASVDDPEPDPNQPALPFAAPAVPVVRCTAIDVDGVVYAISPEQADVMDRLEVSADKPERLIVDGTHRTIVAVKRGKACDTCGIVEPHHRPECAGMKRESEEEIVAAMLALGDQPNAPSESLDDALDGSPDPYDRNDTAAVAAHIAGMMQPNDAPLTPVGEDTKPLTKVTPKRKKAAASEGGVSS